MSGPAPAGMPGRRRQIRPSHHSLDSKRCRMMTYGRIIMASPTKSCSLDPVPTFILKEVLDVLLPYLTHMCNASLSGGQLPVSQRHAIITPLLKKSSLDPAELKNYRPVSNLTFMSKIVEKLVSGQLVGYLQSNNLMPRFQSAYRRHHSTETALLRVISDIVGAVDRGCVTLLGLLDLSAAFDTVDHTILLDRLRIRFGVGGGVLGWIRTFLVGRTQQVLYMGRLSSIGRLDFGVPQGSVLGPLLFLLYTAELFEVINRKGLVAHSYADDTQVHLSVPASESPVAARQFSECIEEIDGWMRSNRLKMNTDKTQLIWIGTRQQLSKVDINEIELQLDTVSFSTSVSDLGVILDNQLKMTDHVAALCRSCFFQLRQIRSIRRSLTSDARKTLVNAFVMSRLDYCNSLCQGINEGLLNKLQHIQNAAARLVTDTRKYDHITPVLRDLHWLPIRQRIVFKLATMVYKCQHGLCPSYLAEDCILLSATRGRQHLRSAGRLELLVPRTRTVTFGPRAFAVAGPGVWNSLPPALREPTLSFNCFRRGLKTFLFR